MAITLDPATQNEYLVGATVVARAQGVVAAFTGTVTCKIYDGSDVEKAAATFDSPWASAIGATITIGEVGKLIVSDGGTPDDNWYVEISNGTRWLRGTFGLLGSGKDFTWSASTFATGQQAELGTVTLTASVPVTTSAPSNTAVPVINGTPQVGQVLSVTDGVWSGSPTPTYTYRWNRGGVDLPGQTAATYTLVSADEGAMIGARVTATNSAGSASASATAVGPIDPLVSALTFSGLPSPIPLYQGGTFSLASYVSGGVTPYTFSYTGTLPSGVSLDASPGVLTATSSATLGTSGSIQFHVDDSAAVASLPTFGITSSVGGTNLPFAFGHVFVEGDIPSGSYVNSDLTDWQAVPTTYWPDGSLRHAIIAGRATCSANVLKSIALSVSATNRSGTALTEADLAAALPTTTLVAGGDSFTLNSLVGTAARHRTVCSGPVMSNWIYRRQIAGSTTLVAWFDVRLYVGGAVEIFPWAENCPLLLSTTNDIRTWTLTIAGVQRFSQSIDIKHHTRVPLINNTAASFKHWSYWTGTDPQIEPKHDTAYMMATKLVPNYGWRSPTSAAYSSGTTQTYSPNWIGDGGTALNNVGWQPRIGVHPNNMALFLSSSADARAYRSMMANGLAGGSWSIHARDEGYGNEPLVFSNRSTLWQQGRPGTGGQNGTGDDASHQPQYAMIPWLVTGRWWFLDEALMWVASNYLWQSPTNRNNADGVILSFANNETRGAAWALLHLGQALAITPTTHPCYASLLASMNANVLSYHGRYVAGTLDGGTFLNNLGVLGHYSSGGDSAYGTPGGVNAWWAAPWMESYMATVFGELYNLNLPISASAQLVAVRDHGYKFPVGLFGDGSAGNFNWRRASAYKLPIGTDSIDFPPDTWYTDFGQCYAAYCAGIGLNAGVSAASGLSFFDNENEADTPANGEDFTQSFLGMNLVALAYAAEHGAPGAAAARARAESSSSWPLTNSGPLNYNNLPVWGIAPRSA